MTMFAPRRRKGRKTSLLVSLSPGLKIFLERAVFAPGVGESRKTNRLVTAGASKTTCLQIVSNSVFSFFYLNIKHLSAIRD